MKFGINFGILPQTTNLILQTQASQENVNFCVRGQTVFVQMNRIKENLFSFCNKKFKSTVFSARQKKKTLLRSETSESNLNFSVHGKRVFIRVYEVFKRNLFWFPYKKFKNAILSTLQN